MAKKQNSEAETPIVPPAPTKERLGEGDAPGWYLCEWRGQEQVLWWDGEMLRVMRHDSHRWKVDGETNFLRVVDSKQLSDALNELAKTVQRLADAERERDEARKAILAYGNNPAGFDWAVLERISEFEEKLQAAEAKLAEVTREGKS